MNALWIHPALSGFFQAAVNYTGASSLRTSVQNGNLTVKASGDYEALSAFAQTIAIPFRLAAKDQVFPLAQGDLTMLWPESEIMSASQFITNTLHRHLEEGELHPHIASSQGPVKITYGILAERYLGLGE